MTNEEKIDKAIDWICDNISAYTNQNDPYSARWDYFTDGSFDKDVALLPKLIDAKAAFLRLHAAENPSYLVLSGSSLNDEEIDKLQRAIQDARAERGEEPTPVQVVDPDDAGLILIPADADQSDYSDLCKLCVPKDKEFRSQ